MYYDSWLRRKIDQQTAIYRVAATRIVPDEIPTRWIHLEHDAVRVRRDASYNYAPGRTYIENDYVGYNTF